jgi:putative ABC transport system ATP-binding protein
MTMPRAYGMVLDAAKNVVGGEIPNIIYDLTLYQFVGALGVFLFIGIAADYGRIIMLRVLGEKLVARLRSNVVKKTMNQDAEFFDVHKVGDLISRLGSDAYVVSRSMTQNVSDGFKHLINGSISIGSMFYISAHLASTLFIFLPGILIGTIIFGNRVRIISRSIQEATGNLSKIGEEQLNGIKTVQSFVAEGKELLKYNGAIRNVYKLGFREAKLNATFYSGVYAISDVTFLVILSYGANLVASGAMSVGDLAAFMLYVNHSGSAMYGLAAFYSELMKGTGAASRLFELIDRSPKINQTIGKPVLTKPLGEIEFKNVSFEYPTRPKLKIFQNLNFRIPRNSNVCIVGPSGRGKSTIASLLLRYYNPTGGEILIDGQDITKFNVKQIRRYLGVVQQEPILMSGTIRDNITFGLKNSKDITMEEIIAVAEKSNCHEFISKFPNGYDTIIGPRGALLSGGQKQRISIARALIKHPSILILDEATSALDSKSEYAINQTLQKLMQTEKITTISIAHRKSTIEKSDLIIVLGYDGTVAETGHFDELYSNTESNLYKLLNDEEAAHPDKRRPDDTKTSEELEQDKLAEEFINKEIFRKGLGDLEHQSEIILQDAKNEAAEEEAYKKQEEEHVALERMKKDELLRKQREVEAQQPN